MDLAGYNKHFTFPATFRIVLANEDMKFSILINELKTKTKVENLKFKSIQPLLFSGEATLLDVVYCSNAEQLHKKVEYYDSKWVKEEVHEGVR